MKIRLNEWFSKCHQASMSYEIYRESPVCANFTDTHRRQFYWIFNRYFHLKFKHIHKSHISFKGFIVKNPGDYFRCLDFFSKIYCPVSVQFAVSGHRLCKSLVSPPQCPTPRAPSVCPTRHFPAAGSRASERELLLTCPTPSHCTVVNPGQSKCTDWYL